MTGLPQTFAGIQAAAGVGRAASGGAEAALAPLREHAGWLLPALVVLPLAVSLALLALRRLGDGAATVVAAGAAAVTLVLAALVTAAGAPYDAAAAGTAPRMDADASWIPALGVRAHLAVDGVSAPLVLLSALLGLLVCWHLVRVRPVAGRARALAACYLAVEGGALAVFTARDLLLFFVAFEVVLVPMWFVVAVWGDDGQRRVWAPLTAPGPAGEAARRDAANRFILFTALGSAVMLLGLLLVALRSGTTDIAVLAQRAAGGGGGSALSHGEQVVAAALIVGGLAVKAPMFPLHTWLPPAHTVAPTGGSVLLAGVLLKLGTYGMVRVAVPDRAGRRPHPRPAPGCPRCRRHPLGRPRVLRGTRPQAAGRVLVRRAHGLRAARHRLAHADRAAGRVVRERRARPRHRVAVPRRRRPEGPAPLRGPRGDRAQPA